MNTREKLECIYLDFFNDYLTIKHYANCNGLTEKQAKSIIDLSRSVYESRHQES